MKTSIPFFFAAVLAATCCSLLDPPLGFDEPGKTVNGADSSRNGGIRLDTVLMVSAVSFPGSYDWQRDSAFGAVNCTLELYEGRKRVLSLAAGPSKRISPSPDRHHIIGGALYSDYYDRSGTVVKRNGVTLFEWDEPEIITGLMPLGESLYSLGRSESGDGFSFRRDGRVILESDSGVPLGGFGMDTYGPTGALYTDKGRICFGYKDNNSACIVRDGVVETVVTDADAQYLDAKVLNGIPAVLLKHHGYADLFYDGYFSDYAFGGSVDWLEAGIFIHGSEPHIAGLVASGTPGRSTYGVLKNGDYTNLGAETGHIFFENGEWYPLETEGELKKRYYFFNRDCAAIIGKRFVLALTPRDGGFPLLVDGCDTLEYKLHGYLSGVAVVIREHDAD